MKILVADDSELNRAFVLAALADAGHDVTLVPSGIDALSEVSTHSYDAVLLDISMPGLDGIETARRIRQWERGTERHVRLVALTAQTGAREQARCAAAGIDAFLSKPLDVDALYRLLDERAPSPSATTESRHAAATAGTAPPVDWTSLERRIGGDPETLRALFALFRRDVPGLLDALSAAVSRGDAKGGRAAAHTLTGMSRNLSATAAVALASDVEQWIARSEFDRALLAADRLRTELARVGEAFESHLSDS